MCIIASKLLYPPINSLLLICSPGKSLPALITFQIITDGGEHNVDLASLFKVDGFGAFPNIHRYHVVVTPKAIDPKIMVSVAYFQDKLEEMAHDKIFSVFDL